MKNVPLIRDFWERVDEAVTTSGKSKTQIAREAGFDRKALSRSNGSGMHSRVIAAFCAVTGADANYLLGLRRTT